MADSIPSVYTGDILDDDINSQFKVYSQQKSNKVDVDKRIFSIIRLGTSCASNSGASADTGSSKSSTKGAGKTPDVIYISDDEDKDKDKDEDVKCLKIPIYNHEHDNILSDTFYDKLPNIFPKIFKPDDPKLSYEGINTKMIDNFNYKIIKVDLIKNTYNEEAFKLKQKYLGIKEKPIIVFHGTDEKNIDKILEEGFDWRYNRRYRFGYGYYASTCMFRSLQYSEPNANGEQKVLVFEYIKGKTAIGSNNQRDFGDNITLTNPEGNYICGKDKEQFRILFQITMRYNKETIYTTIHKLNMNTFLHNSIFKKLVHKDKNNDSDYKTTMVIDQPSDSAATAAFISAVFSSGPSLTGQPGRAAAPPPPPLRQGGHHGASAPLPTGQLVVPGQGGQPSTNIELDFIPIKIKINNEKCKFDIKCGTKVVVEKTFLRNTLYFNIELNKEGVVEKILQNTSTKKKYIYVKFLDKTNNDNLVKIHTTNPKILDNIAKQQNDWIKLKLAQVSVSVNDSVFDSLSGGFARFAPAPIGVQAPAPGQAPNTASGSSSIKRSITSDDTSTNKRTKLPSN